MLRGLNELWNLGLTLEELAELGLKIGSDVPFCVHGGTAVARGRGEKLEFLPAPPPCWVVLVKPPMSVSTKDIYSRIDLNNMKHPDTPGMINAINQGAFPDVCQKLENVMEEVTFNMHPQVAKIKQAECSSSGRMDRL